ncbi:cytosolic phospholipase A2 gamma-like isoform X3 [Carassius gibelio]|uniref:cytosolic phospholipase A2 gamma-like isoform X3 n=1 Tax=Carassius gibelio TaxID=101364 RepID=UPI002278F1B1|nr:cytosolic phospholipase A2 gamma-like isoform X3 [Carassius gibelio]XP_052412973.1 cytosolic phospholipase A2 gamma-like isoform X3 [Carassius gibelio]XP_052412974.1 cytosolic phospholipase A2 gamma-like isoform X3 [Carassius gibelio]
MSANHSKPKESVKRRNKNVLNNSEQEFVAGRRNTVLQSLKKVKIQCSQKEVPNIALLGSGGGQRAMVGLLGSLVQLDKAGLLDCILYLSGVSGSTWCMASLYKEPNWSTKLETVKNKIIKRLNGPEVSLTDAMAKLKKYYYGKDFFSLTDVWAVMLVASIVKEIDEHTLTEQRNQHNKDPFPIYAVIDKQIKQSDDGDPWFEINPYEAGYSLSGVFVDTSDFGSQFHKGSKIKHQDEFDMLYLQALCGSALGDEVAIKNDMWQKIKDFFQNETTLEAMRKEEHERSEERHEAMRIEKETDPISPSVDECHQALMDLLDKHMPVFDLSGGRSPLISSMKIEKQYIKHFAMDVCEDLSSRSNIWQFDAGLSICKCMAEWIWGRKYNFLHNLRDEAVNSTLLQSETRDYIDAGVLLNSPYFSVLREDRDIDLIISLDFSEGDPFMTVRDAAETCKKLKIPFPEVKVPSDEGKKPKDFYVFKGQNAPTVIHIPLFNTVNCGDKVEDWRKKYRTFQGSYSAEMIADLMDVAGKNISNNREKLKEQIRAVIEEKDWDALKLF